MQALAPALNGIKADFMPVLSHSNYRLGLYLSGWGNMTGSLCEVYADMETMVPPGMNSPIIVVPSGGVFRLRAAATGGYIRRDSSRQARRYGSCFTLAHGAMRSPSSQVESSSSRNLANLSGLLSNRYMVFVKDIAVPSAPAFTKTHQSFPSRSHASRLTHGAGLRLHLTNVKVPVSPVSIFQ